ncbi:MAG: response regulator transcription factor [Phycisphaerae bacterium]
MSTAGHASSAICLLAPTELDRAAWKLLLLHEFQREVASEAGFAPVAVWHAMRSAPDLALVCADRPSNEIRDAIQMIPRLRRQTRVLVIGGLVEIPHLRTWALCPLDGYVVKDGGVAELRVALDAMLAVGSYFSNGLRGELESARAASNSKVALSKRESELLPLLANGMTLREAAAIMTVSYKTADSYRTSLLRKLGVRDRVELARYAIRERIVDL